MPLGAGRGRPKGIKKTGGRQKGTQNRATQDVRAAIAAFAEGTAAEFVSWVKQTAQGAPKRTELIGKGAKAKTVVLDHGRAPDPAHAAEIYLKAIEYHIPKLARTEVTGEGGKPLIPPAFGVTFPQGFPGAAGAGATTTEDDAADKPGTEG